MSSRVLKNDHVRIGWSAVSESRNAKRRPISSLSLYPANTAAGYNDAIGITMFGSEGTAVAYLLPEGAKEVVKGLLMNLLRKPITMAADDEFRFIIEQVRAAIDLEDEDARAVVECLKRQPG